MLEETLSILAQEQVKGLDEAKVFLPDDLERMERMIGNPNEIDGTNTPSMTSMWICCAPALSICTTCAPNFEKSAANIEGANIIIANISFFPCILHTFLHSCHNATC